MFQATLLILVSAATLAAADFDVRDQAEFNKIFPKDAKVQKLASGFMFIEGPVWISQDGGYLVFSDIPANEMKRWDAAGGVKTFRKPSGSANGNTLDREGRLLSAQHDGRLTRTEKDGKVVTIADKFEGKPLHAPNDVVVKSDGTIWFTDPDYVAREGATPGKNVYRLSSNGTTLTAVVTGLEKPNGLCFSPDERTLYVAEAGPAHNIRAYPVNSNGSLGTMKVLATIDNRFPDGIRCDAAGRVWSSAGDGIHIFSPSGALIAKVLTPEGPANLAFGGAKGTTVFITAATSLFSVEALVRGAKR